MSVLINGLYWGVGDPRLLTCKDARNLMKVKPTATKGLSDKLLPHRLIAISDISADPQVFQYHSNKIDLTNFWSLV